MPNIAKKHERLKQRKGYNAAKVASARDMLKIVYHILKEQRPFYRDTEDKISWTRTVPALSGV